MDTKKRELDFFDFELYFGFNNTKFFDARVKQTELRLGKDKLLFSESDKFHVDYSIEGKEAEELVDEIIHGYIYILEDRTKREWLPDIGWYTARGFRKDQRKNIRNAVKGIIANLIISFHAFGGTGFVRIPRGNEDYKTSRYNPLITKRNLIDVLDRLSYGDEYSFMQYYKAVYFENKYKGKVSFNRFTSRYRATGRLYDLMQDSKIGYRNLIRVSDTIILKGKTNPTSPYETYQLYRETDKTTKMRNDLAKYNALLKKNHNRIRGDMWDKNNEVIQITNHGKMFYHRIFTRNNFESGGRFYGHWIVQAPSISRKFIKINAKPTRILDYSACLMHVAYSTLNIGQYTGKDLYGMVDEDRAWVKAFCTIAPNTKRLKTACQQTIKELGLKWNLKNENRVYNLAHLISEAHDEVYKAYFFKGKDLGQRLVYHESCIANEVIMHFVRKGIIILVIHDGFCIEKKHRKELFNVMNDKWNQYWKKRGVVSSKPIIKEDKHISEIDNPIDSIGTFKHMLDS